MRHLGLFLIGIILSIPTWALDLGTPVLQMNHRAYRAEDGAPAHIDVIEQTADGTLWVGGGAGLSRFDGIRFVSYPGPADEPLPSTNISSLLASPDGGLWIGYRLGGASFLMAGRVTNFGPNEGLPESSLLRFARDPDGSVWAATRTGLAHLKGKRWEKDPEATNLVSVLGFLIDRAGTHWIVTPDALLARRAGEHFREVDRRTYAPNPRAVLAEAPDGTIWAAAWHDLVRIDQAATSANGGALTLRGHADRPLLPIAFDRDGGLWAADRGLLHVAPEALERMDPAHGTIDAERFMFADGLTGETVYSIMQDREGNIWAGTSDGLDRFSPTQVVRNAEVCTAPAFAAGDDGSLRIACRRDFAFTAEVRGGAVVNLRKGPELTAAYRDSRGTVWFGGPNVLAHLDEHDALVSEPLPPEARDAQVQAIVRDGAGAIWVSVPRRGVFRLLDGAWSRRDDENGLPRGYALAETSDEAGRLWFGYTNSRIARMDNGHVQLFEVGVGNVLSIRAQDGEVWVGGELGFARFDGARFALVHDASGMQFRGITGVVRDRNGDLWLNGISGISHILRRDINELIRDPAHRIQVETLSHADGVRGNAVSFRPIPSAAEATDGRIWFARSGGFLSIDATRLVRNALPPPVTIWSLTSGDQQHRNEGQDTVLPVHTNSLEIEYSAGSLTVPERVQFRYRLEGLEQEWQDAGTRREARYTNLGPGRYSFRVIASNNDGVWNETGAAIRFTIPPAYYQTGWFYALCALLCLAVLMALYRVRMRHVAAQISGQLEARLAERERIARELHDTLLQGVQGLILRFQAAADRIPSSEPARRLMELSLDRADKLLGESRDKVRELRPTQSDVAELSVALAAEGERFAELQSAHVRVSVQGACRDLQPIVREELFLIGREALANAFQHARAIDIEAEVTYGADALQIRIRDDGQGIDTDVLVSGGKPGHFGLIGMRERAKKLGGHVEVWSKPGAGTEVSVRVPADVAYTRTPRVPRHRRWWPDVLRPAGRRP